MEGNIMVDGVMASCYASIGHDLGHIGITPIRWFPEKMEMIFGNDNQCYVDITTDVGNWILPHGM